MLLVGLGKGVPQPSVSNGPFQKIPRVSRIGEQNKGSTEELAVHVVLDQAVHNQEHRDSGMAGGVVDDPIKIGRPLGRGHVVV